MEQESTMAVRRPVISIAFAFSLAVGCTGAGDEDDAGTPGDAGQVSTDGGNLQTDGGAGIPDGGEPVEEVACVPHGMGYLFSFSWHEVCGQPCGRTWNYLEQDLTGHSAYGYDTDGRLVSMVSYNEQGDLSDDTSIEYAGDGSATLTLYGLNGYSNGVPQYGESTTLLEFDTDGRILSSSTGTYELVYYYDSAGRLFMVERYGLNDLLDMIIDFTYSADGTLFRVERDDGANGTIDVRTAYTYPANGVVKEDVTDIAGAGFNSFASFLYFNADGSPQKVESISIFASNGYYQNDFGSWVRSYGEFEFICE